MDVIPSITDAPMPPTYFCVGGLYQGSQLLAPAQEYLSDLARQLGLRNCVVLQTAASATFKPPQLYQFDGYQWHHRPEFDDRLMEEDRQIKRAIEQTFIQQVLDRVQ